MPGAVPGEIAEGCETVVKVMMFVKRKPGLSREEFRKYYEEVHAPLSMKHLAPYYARYARNYISHSIEGEEPDFDCVTEIWFKDGRTAQALTDALGGSDTGSGYVTVLGRIFHDDEERFMDRSRRVSFTVTEEDSDMSGLRNRGSA